MLVLTSPRVRLPGVVTFGTERLEMRPWTHDQSDVERMLDMYSRWEVARWLGANPKAMETIEQAHQTVDNWAARTDGPYGVWAVQERTSATIVGTVLLVPLPEPADGDGHGEVEVGWHFHPDSWGQGYGSEAGRGVLERGFAAGLPELFAVVRPEHERSRAVCARLGMTPLGETDRWYGLRLSLFRARPSTSDS
jgi:RimJ/RimL family protein N-acetyltransferase